MRNYYTYIFTLLISALGAFIMTPIVRKLAIYFGAVDVPNERKIHKTPMPRWGGICVFIGFCLPWIGYYFLDNKITETFRDFERLSASILAAGFCMLVLGIYDDVKGANAAEKLSVQFVTAIVLYCVGFRITTLSIPFGTPMELQWLSMPVSVLWIVGITNAINLLDGVDGLVSGVTACISLCLAIINILHGHTIVALFTLCLSGACLGFLPHNFSPAKIFLGDSGSLFIGMTLACIGIVSLFKATTASLVLVPLILFGLPLFDTTSVMIGRFLRRAPIFSADKSHLHHRFLKMGFNHKQVALFFYAISLFLGGQAVFLVWQQSDAIALWAAVVVACISLVIWWFWRLANRKPLDKDVDLPNGLS